MRLDYLIQEWMLRVTRGVSLKKAQIVIRGGAVSIDGKVALNPKQQVLTQIETVEVDGTKIDNIVHELYVMNKPAGVVCQRHPKDPTVYELIPEKWQRDDLVTIGRLDRDTTGMLLLGTDGGLQSLLTSPESRVWKTYDATMDPNQRMHTDAEEQFKLGLKLEDGTQCQPANLELPVGGSLARVCVHEGFFHQVKRMLVQVGGKVLRLHRCSFGCISDPGLSSGQMRPLSLDEHHSLAEMLPLKRVSKRPLQTDRTSTCSESKKRKR